MNLHDIESAKPGSQPVAGKRVLIVTAVAVERDAVLRGLAGDDRFVVRAVGVGPAEAAAGTAAALAVNPAGYSLVISAGIAGGFPGKAAVGSLVVADRIVAADLGAETPEGFRSVDELGFGTAAAAVDSGRAERAAAAIRAAGLDVATGPVLTLSTVTGTAATAEELAARIPGAAAEAMEGYGAAAAARLFGLPVLEIRSVSNPVGPRDRGAWRIPEALQALEQAFAIMKEELL